jgi:hypothetical protein
VLSPARVEVERGGVRHVAAGVVRNDGDVIAYLRLLRPAFERIKRIAYRDVRRPGNAAVGAERIE